MYLLAEALPVVRRWRPPFTRDQLFLLMAAFNEYMLALEIYRSACAPRDLDGQLLGELFIHVYGQETPDPTANAMIWRGAPPVSCRVATLSLEGLGEVEDEATH